MLKKIFIVSFITLMSIQSYAQNLQFHWDFSQDRNYPTVTFEMFKADKLGSTFFFIDMDFDGFSDPSLAYTEFSRKFKLGQLPIQFHAEYNGGLWAANSTIGGQLKNAWLVGASYPFAIGKSFFEIIATYKHIMRTDKKANAQITGVWNIPLWRDKVVCTGFFDVWSEEANDGKGREAVFITEPQFWYNICSKFAVGTEIEISKNFLQDNSWGVYPTLAAKWTF